MQDIVYLNGDFIPKTKAYIHVDDRGFYFGDGVYEVIKFYAGKPFCFEEHLERLKNSLHAVRINSISPEIIELVCNRLINLNDLHNTHAAVYMQITRGVAPRTHSLPSPGTVPTIYAYAFPMPFAENDAREGINVATTEDIRWNRCNIKAITLLPNTLTFQDACDKGAKECLYIREGILTECSHSNIMAVKNNTVFTHPECNHILSGITRKVVLNMCGNLKIEIREFPVKASDITCYDEFFITGTGSEILPVVSIDGNPVGKGMPGEITRKLQREFYNMTYTVFAGENIEI